MLISTAHFENAAPVLGDLDLGRLLLAKERMAKGDTGAVTDLLVSLAAGGKAKVFRKLAAIAGASLDDILAAEADPSKFLAMETATARRPFLEVFQEALGFIAALVPMSTEPPASSEGETETATEPKAESTPSAVS